MTVTQLLVVHDDRPYSEWLRNNLEAEGYEVAPADTVANGLRLMDELPPDLAILGHTTMIGPLRRRTADTPVMFLTTNASEATKLKAFALGVDDCVARPVGIRALAARVHALLRRTRPPERAGPSWVRIGDIELRPAARTARRAGVPIRLTPIEYELLLTLLRNRDRAVSREELLRTVWQWAPDGPTRTVDNHVSSLRRKLGRNAGHSRLIVTQDHKRGYRFSVGADT
jgi:two-component system OmpR family response regulator